MISIDACLLDPSNKKRMNFCKNYNKKTCDSIDNTHQSEKHLKSSEVFVFLLIFILSQQISKNLSKHICGKTEPLFPATRKLFKFSIHLFLWKMTLKRFLKLCNVFKLFCEMQLSRSRKIPTIHFEKYRYEMHTVRDKWP